MSGSNNVATGTKSEVKPSRKFEVEALCDAILEKIFKLRDDLEPALRGDDGTTPDTREGSPLIMSLQAIDEHLAHLIDRVDL